eukprot:CAMPEP_0119336942 /NCGR_PEP_ID=MMETSP1333-20130426/92941_1 /TAXON_ID=418940 /ORGANISM="Scyphosphaera apsteinii, Strain RCC1455" /LENGTH=651 /DNA_ID=CAMNT_0007347879 /DNA_START=172 /DNA_END=2127 /DNA_ORIENTATION=-
MDSDHHDWVFLTDEATGCCYYANTRTRETRWDPPWATGAEEESSGGLDGEPYTKLANGWFKYFDEASRQPYYYNKVTQETMWTMPADALLPDGCTSDRRSLESRRSTNYLGRQSTAATAFNEDFDSSDEEPPPLPAELQRLNGASNEVSTSSRCNSLEPGDEAAREKEKADKRAARRLKILEEVVSSEKTYVQKLQTLEKVYMIPLRMVADQPKGAIFKHEDLDSVFMNMDMLVKVNSRFLEELEAESDKFPDVHYGIIIAKAAKQFKGCYTRYVNNYDQAEGHLNKLKKGDKEKHRYLEVCKTHPEAGGYDVRDFLILPVQRVPRYRMLLEDLLGHTDPGHPDEEPLKDALERIREVAMHINEEKRHADEVEKLRALLPRFSNGSNMEKELVRYDRKFEKEGEMVKVRLAHRQRRHVFLFNDILIYAVSSKSGFVVKGKIPLILGARIEMLPDTEHLQHAFAVIEPQGKGYTWVGDTEEQTREWFEAISASIRSNRPNRESTAGGKLLADVSTKPLAQRLEALKAGTTLMKYNQRDGKSGARWVRISGDQTKICWGDVKKKDTPSDMKLGEAVALLHGAKSSAFFKQQGAKKDQDWLCFSVVFKGRTLDFAATNAELLLDWYLALAQLIPKSTEPLLDETELRTRIEGMF